LIDNVIANIIINNKGVRREFIIIFVKDIIFKEKITTRFDYIITIKILRRLFH
jgi:hypothetical protein